MKKLSIFFFNGYWFWLASLGLVLPNYVCAIHGLWQENGLPICTAERDQYSVVIHPTGANEYVIVWEDLRLQNLDVFIQKINNSGTILWPADGVPIVTHPHHQYWVKSTADETGGAILAWTDERTGNGRNFRDIYAQRIDTYGNVLWALNGKVICTAVSSQGLREILPDGYGGAILIWDDERNGNSDIYAQRLNSLGLPLWSENGIPIITAVSDQNIMHAISDQQGGLIVTWIENKNDDGDIFAQRIASTGDLLWNQQGVAVCLANNKQFEAKLYLTPLSEIMISWSDKRSDASTSDIFIQKLTLQGIPQWIENGLAICVVPLNQNYSQLIVDSDGHLMVAWQDGRTGSNDIFMQKIASDGHILWEENGRAICSAPEDQNIPQLLPDDNMGALLVWEDFRNNSNDLYAQRFDASGKAVWKENGISICSANDDQFSPHITADGQGGLIAEWRDKRNQEDFNIFTQRLIRPRPEFLRLDPETIQHRSGEISINFFGEGFIDDKGSIDTLRLIKADESPLIPNNFQIQDSQSLMANFSLTLASSGEWNIIAYDTLGQTSTASTKFTITKPTITKGTYAAPNPFLPMRIGNTTFHFFPKDVVAGYSIRIFDLHGREKRHLVNRDQWDGLDNSGNKCEGGTYFYQVKTSSNLYTGKVILIY